MVDAARRLLVFALVFAPLAFGAVEPWSRAVVELSCLAALWLFLWGKRGEGAPGLVRVPGLWPLLGLLSFAALQLVPLPLAVVEALSPAAARAYADALGAPEWVRLSLHPRATASELLRLAAYAAAYLLSVQLLSDRERLRTTAAAVVWLGAGVAFFAVAQHLVPNGKLYWLRTASQGGAFFGPFVNRNHYAGFIGMLAPLAVALCLHYRPRHRFGSWRERLVYTWGDPKGSAHVLLTAAAVLMATSVFLSLSRGGIASLCLSTLVLGAALALRARGGRAGWAVAALSAAVLLGVGWFGWAPVLERFDALRDAQGAFWDHRFQYWRDAAGAARDFAAVGSGFGSFERVFRGYRTLVGPFTVEHAHNDYLELLVEGGWVGLGLAGWFVGAVAWAAVRRLRLREESYAIYLTLGALAGLVSILAHSAVDFNLHVGSNGLLFFFLAGLAVSGAHTRLRGPAPTYLAPWRGRPGAAHVVAAAALAAAVVGHAADGAGRWHGAVFAAADPAALAPDRLA
ncbi:MAG: O-antigen ligase family protein, partial [Deferrisomatales bacterium]